jgi:integrase
MYGSRPITAEEHVLIMKTLSEDHIGFRKSPTVILILSIIASTGLRLGDTLQLKMKNITSVGGMFRLKVREEKTDKVRDVPLPAAVYMTISEYCMANHRSRNERIFQISERAVSKKIKKVVEFLELGDDVTSHSWRKFFAMTVYSETGSLVDTSAALLHTSLSTTQRYLAVNSERLQEVLLNNCQIVNTEEE